MITARNPVTKEPLASVTSAVTKPIVTVTLDVTKRTKPPGSGRRKVYASGAAKQRAYRERVRAKG